MAAAVATGAIMLLETGEWLRKFSIFQKSLKPTAKLFFFQRLIFCLL